MFIQFWCKNKNKLNSLRKTDRKSNDKKNQKNRKKITKAMIATGMEDRISFSKETKRRGKD